jgi:DNA-binding IclR family transcriptional regulator
VTGDNLLHRGIKVIEKLSALGAQSSEELYKETQIPRSSVYRILRILEENGYVSRIKNGSEDNWRLDLRILRLSAAIMSRLDLKTETRDILMNLADDTKEIVQLAIMDMGKVIILDNVKRHKSIVNVAHEGTVLEINECVAGLVFGAYLSVAELDELIEGRTLAKLTQYTITNQKKFRAELLRVRKNGFAVDNQYYAVGHRCIGAPIRDHTGRVVAEINISGHVSTITDDKIERLASKVMKRAREASLRLGYKDSWKE